MKLQFEFLNSYLTNNFEFSRTKKSEKPWESKLKLNLQNFDLRSSAGLALFHPIKVFGFKLQLIAINFIYVLIPLLFFLTIERGKRLQKFLEESRDETYMK